MAEPDPGMRAVLEQLARARRSLPNRYELPFPDARAQLLQERQPWLADGPACPSIMREVNTAGRSFDMHVYRPEAMSGQHMLVYFHGGGWCVGSSATHDNIVRRLACTLACESWSVDYALAPEAPFPQGLLDCIAAVELAAIEKPNARLVVAGDSAGANLALGAAMHLRDRGRALIDALLLFYGVYTDDCSDSSMEMYGDGRYGLSLSAQRRYLDAYISSSRYDLPDAAYAFPLHDEANLAGLPRSWLTVAELDILRDQSHALAARLRRAGGLVHVDEIAGVVHGFLSFGRSLRQVDSALDAAVQWVLDNADAGANANGVQS
jgi:acetyl esterase